MERRLLTIKNLKYKLEYRNRYNDSVVRGSRPVDIISHIIFFTEEERKRYLRSLQISRTVGTCAYDRIEDLGKRLGRLFRTNLDE